MTNLEIQEQAERLAIDWHYPDSIAKGIRDESGEYYPEFETTMNIIEIGLKAGAKWMQEQDKWISVEDRLPKSLQTVWLSNGKGFICLGCLVDDNDGWHWAESNGIIYIDNEEITSECESDDLDISFWMPLPSPPKTK